MFSTYQHPVQGDSFVFSHIYLTLYIEPLSLNSVSYLSDNSFHLQVAQSQHNPKYAYILPSNSCPTCTYYYCPIFLTAVNSCWPGLSSFRHTLQFSDCLEYYLFPPYKHRQTLSPLLICITILPRNQSLTHLTVTRIKKLSLIRDKEIGKEIQRLARKYENPTDKPQRQRCWLLWWSGVLEHHLCVVKILAQIHTRNSEEKNRKC